MFLAQLSQNLYKLPGKCPLHELNCEVLCKPIFRYDEFVYIFEKLFLMCYHIGGGHVIKWFQLIHSNYSLIMINIRKKLIQTGMQVLQEYLSQYFSLDIIIIFSLHPKPTANLRSLVVGIMYSGTYISLTARNSRTFLLSDLQ